MDYFVRRRVKNLALRRTCEMIRVNLKKPVLHASEALTEMARFSPSGEMDFADDLPPVLVDFVREKTKYWLKTSGGIVYAVKLGEDSDFIAAPALVEVTKFFSPIASQSFSVILKDCSKLTGEKTFLSVYVSYDAETKSLRPQVLTLKGVNIMDFPHGYWKVKTFIDGGEASDGCSGLMSFKVRYNPYFEINIAENVSYWTGEKILKAYAEDEQESAEDMLSYWKKFWALCGKKQLKICRYD